MTKAEEILQKHLDPHCLLKKGCLEAIHEAMKEHALEVIRFCGKNGIMHDADSLYTKEMYGAPDGWFTIHELLTEFEEKI